MKYVYMMKGKVTYLVLYSLLLSLGSFVNDETGLIFLIQEKSIVFVFILMFILHDLCNLLNMFINLTHANNGYSIQGQSEIEGEISN